MFPLSYTCQSVVWGKMKLKKAGLPPKCAHVLYCPVKIVVRVSSTICVFQTDLQLTFRRTGDNGDKALVVFAFTRIIIVLQYKTHDWTQAPLAVTIS